MYSLFVMHACRHLQISGTGSGIECVGDEEKVRTHDTHDPKDRGKGRPTEKKEMLPDFPFKTRSE